MRREVIVVTNGLLDGSAEAPPEPAEGAVEALGTWERIFQGQAEWLAREL
jgi:hypothetical protein